MKFIKSIIVAAVIILSAQFASADPVAKAAAAATVKAELPTAAAPMPQHRRWHRRHYYRHHYRGRARAGVNIRLPGPPPRPPLPPRP